MDNNLKFNFYGLDIFKFVFSFFVIGIHTNPLSSINLNLNYYLVNGLFRIAVPFFFTTSSLFLFFKINNIEVEKDRDKVIFIYLKRIFMLYLIWTLIYSPFIIREFFNSKQTFLIFILKKIWRLMSV